jgi:hypothetical protein
LQSKEVASAGTSKPELSLGLTKKNHGLHTLTCDSDDLIVHGQPSVGSVVIYGPRIAFSCCNLYNTIFGAMAAEKAYTSITKKGSQWEKERLIARIRERIRVLPFA